ncbi:hypothetical protein FBEOM_9596 [Fusarium beomiforme]|uniref:DUF7708 domain-containing protein n=1 Tax=Fusarium beomiforme TaxID=44412 RepID=A0A9P5DVR0_9HYPO|nr:hypothetical protein FBEOM_9596 [Fusarium beomiforme]
MDHSMSDYLSTWYSPNIQSQQTTYSNFAFPAAQHAFQEGLNRFASDLTKDADKVEFSKSFSSIQDIQILVRDSFMKYSDEKRFPKARKWLQRAISKIHHYGNIMDVLVQHHPEYVSLAWGAMKFVLVDGKLRHLLHSITRPPELRYKDLLEDIATNSREIDQLAASSAHVEIRDISLKLNTIVAKIESFEARQSSALLNSNQTIVAKLESFQALHSSAQLDTNQRLSDLQFSQIMSHMSQGKLGDPLEAFRFNVSLQMRQDRSRRYETTNEFWQSPKLQNWSSAPESKLAIIKGGFRARHASRKFCINIIQQLQSKNIPVVWALRGPHNNAEEGKASITDLFKHLILQAFKLSQDCATESIASLQCTQFHRANVEQDWLQLLGSSLLRARNMIYLVIDLATIDHNLSPTEGFSWFTAFQNLFKEMVKRAPKLQVKVLLLGNSLSFKASEADIIPSDVVIPIRVKQTPVRRLRRIESHVKASKRKDYC